MAEAAPAAGAEELPRAIVRRVVKKKIAELGTGRAAEEMGMKLGMSRMREIPLHKEALLAFSESAKVFIHYLSAT
jgi:DNA polymerase epsilon subunit 3